MKNKLFFKRNESEKQIIIAIIKKKIKKHK